MSDRTDFDVGEIEYSYARSLRMIGRTDEARAIFEAHLGRELTVERRSTVLLNLSLIYQTVGESREAVEAARAIIKLDRNSSATQQAKAIILEEDNLNLDRARDLLKHEAICRKRGEHVVANNLALSRIRIGSTSGDNVDLELDEVIKSAAQDKDFYSLARAIIRKAHFLHKKKRSLSDKDKRRLIDAYHFLFNERLHNLFDECHSALWEVFESEEEIANLFRLFRHSSLMWRLRGDEEREGRYLRNLARHANVVIALSGTMDREVAYYLVRVSISAR